MVEAGIALGGIDSVLRTPDDRFHGLPDYTFAPSYTLVSNPVGDEPLRMHYVDEGPSDAAVVLALHDDITWSYLYRKMIPIFVDSGFRVVAPDLVGFGRSDKLADRTSYSLAQHVAWVHEFVHALNLNSIILVCQGWGGPVGMAVLAREPDRFMRVVAGNTLLPTLTEEHQPALTGLLKAIVLSQRDRVFDASTAVARATARDVPPDVLAAYDAPFPDERFKQAMRQFPLLTPVSLDDPGAVMNRETFAVLTRFEQPFLTLSGDSDPETSGWEQIFQERIPGALGQPHLLLEGTGHCWPEDRGAQAAHLVVDWLRDRGSMRQRTRPARDAWPEATVPDDEKPSFDPAEPEPRASQHWPGIDDARLTWERVRERKEIRLYAGDIPFFRLTTPGLDYLAEPYRQLVGLSINRSDAHHVLHDLSQPMPLADDSVSSFQSEEVFHYLRFESLAGIIDEIHRALRPGALFRLSFPDYGCDFLRERCLYDSDGRIVFDPGAGGSPQSPTSRWFGRIDVVRSLIESTRFALEGTVDYLHYYEMDGTPVTHSIDYSMGYVARTPDHDRRVMDPYRPMSMVIDLTKSASSRSIER